MKIKTQPASIETDRVYRFRHNELPQIVIEGFIQMISDPFVASFPIDHSDNSNRQKHITKYFMRQ